ncbi:MAG: GntR family transcriptional regulator [candidate division KSB1 bacterium]|nr:GntR family transcriptional regulator [candidate division KSB1 bacterium]MDZ7412666.1 GntR family transcriptional regulator [candidate division KSB1 bacterium]
MALSFDSREPLYFRIKKELLLGIQRGAFKDGRLPTEEELQKMWGASRGTVRRALLELEMEGYVVRRPRKGTFAVDRAQRVRKDLGEVVSFSQQVRAAGFTPGSRLLTKELIKAYEAEGRVCEAFGISPEDEVVWIKRLRLADAHPLAVQSVFLLPSRCAGIFAEDLSELMRLYRQRYGVRLTIADEILRVCTPSASDAWLLQISPTTPVVVREQVSFDEEGKPFEVLRSVEIAERFEYRYRVVHDGTRLSENRWKVPPASHSYEGQFSS